MAHKSFVAFAQLTAVSPLIEDILGTASRRWLLPVALVTMGAALFIAAVTVSVIA
jgi:cadmium resistance protein CadD (predicted permease)